MYKFVVIKSGIILHKEELNMPWKEACEYVRQFQKDDTQEYLHILDLPQFYLITGFDFGEEGYYYYFLCE